MNKCKCYSCKDTNCHTHPVNSAAAQLLNSLKLMRAEKLAYAISNYKQHNRLTVEGIMGIDMGVYGNATKKEAKDVIKALKKMEAKNAML